MTWETEYLKLLARVLTYGETRDSRAGPTLSKFGETIFIPALNSGNFPLLTTRRVYPMGVFGELAAFLRGATTVAEFEKFGCNYWRANAEAWDANEGAEPDKLRVGRIYGAQWRDWMEDGYDQIYQLVRGLKENPTGRRHVVTAWNPMEQIFMCLPPCHIMFQCYVRHKIHLDLQVYMRSVDVCVGLPSDIILYAMLLLLIAHDTDLLPGNLQFVFGDTHVYKNHVDQAYEQLRRTPYVAPEYFLVADTSLDTFIPSDMSISSYTPHKAIKYEFNV